MNAVEIGKGCRTDVKGQSSAMEEDGKALQKALQKAHQLSGSSKDPVTAGRR